MLYTRLGDTGLIVSRLAFGAMTFGSGSGRMAAIAKVNLEAARQLVGKSLDAGVNYFNTADAYTRGQSEEILGETLGHHRKEVIIATKVGFRSGDALVDQGLSRQHIVTSAEGSLRRLRTDYIDVYLLHRVDRLTPIEESLEALDLLVRQGKVLYTGFSNWPAWMAAKAVGVQQCRGFARFRAAEVYYSLVGRELEHELVPFAQDAGIGLTIWSPLAGGFLSGKYTRERSGGEGGRRKSFDFPPLDREKGFDVIDRLQAIAKAHGASPAQIALGWLLAKSYVASVLLGASSLSQLEDNLGAAEVKLAPKEVEELDHLTAAAPIYPNWFNQNLKDEPVEKALEGVTTSAPPVAR